MTQASATFQYAIALGSNRPIARTLPPPALLRAALAALTQQGVVVQAVSRVIGTPPLGPSRRRYANAAALVTSALPPPALLRLLQSIEARFGRRRRRRWGERSLDIDIILWSGGAWRSRHLAIPHPAYARRAFVIVPLMGIVPAWRDPRTMLRVRHSHARLHKGRGAGAGG